VPLENHSDASDGWLTPRRFMFVLCLVVSIAASAGRARGQTEAAAQHPQQTETPAKPVEESARTSPDRAIRIAWVGDIVLEVPWRPKVTAPKTMFDGVRKRLLDFDLVVANLETPLTDWDVETPYKDKAAVEAGRDVIFRVGSPEAASALHEAGIGVVALANNHTMDFTEQGLRDTVKRLNRAGVMHVGGGENLTEAEDLLVVNLKGRRLGLLSFSDVVPRYSWAEANRPGIATAKDAERVVEAVRRARGKADILILILHWGIQFSEEPSPRQEFLAQQAQLAGADLVLGAHPHVLQGIGCLGRVPVVYSAGNFVFPTMSMPTRRTGIFEFDFSDAASPMARLVPLVIDESGAPQLADKESQQEILSHMRQLSLPLGFRFTGDRGTCGELPARSPVSVSHRDTSHER